MYDKYIKRFLDFVLALTGLIAISPILIIASISIWLKMGSPVFFTQQRPGLYRIPFKMIKFRTLTNAKNNRGELLSDDRRLTVLGKFLRSSSIDELPELLNVLKGDMSLVGPRPLRMYYLLLYNGFQNRRHEVRPGITGWAQVNGRNSLTWEKKFGLDVWYVENQSLWLDIKIIIMTFIKVIKREGTTTNRGNFSEPFRGTGGKKVSEKHVKSLKNKYG